MFFLIIGYLIASMLESYNRFEFIFNRIFRIFPTLMVCVIVIGIFLKITQGIVFPFSSYITSITLTYSYVGDLVITGVLWTLVVEVLFYIIAFFVGKFNESRLLFVQILLLALIYYSNINNNEKINFLAINCKYILFILVGTSIRLTETVQKIFDKFSLLMSSVVMSYLGFKIYMISHMDDNAWPNLGSHIITIVIFLGFYLTQNRTKNILGKLPSIFYKIIDLGYPLYLLHVAIGLGTIALLRDKIHNNYLLLLCAVFTSYICAWIVHVLIEKPSIVYGKKIIKRYHMLNGRFRL